MDQYYADNIIILLLSYYHIMLLYVSVNPIPSPGSSASPGAEHPTEGGAVAPAPAAGGRRNRPTSKTTKTWSNKKGQKFQHQYDMI